MYLSGNRPIPGNKPTNVFSKSSYIIYNYIPAISPLQTFNLTFCTSSFTKFSWTFPPVFRTKMPRTCSLCSLLWSWSPLLKIENPGNRSTDLIFHPILMKLYTCSIIFTPQMNSWMRVLSTMHYKIEKKSVVRRTAYGWRHLYVVHVPTFLLFF